MTGQPRLVSVRELFSGTRRFRVPIYQRAYAWGRVEIETLVRDVVSVLDRSAYYIGSLVLHEVRDIEVQQPLFDVIDGQQRLTTLFIALTHPSIRPMLARLDRPFEIDDRLLSFEERRRSNLDLSLLARATSTESTVESLQDEGIHAGAKSIGNILGNDERLHQLLADQGARHEGTTGASLAEEVLVYLLDRVRIVLTELPHGTDLNHYFEVMNTRGEQLEKHEIVKAHLLGLIGDDAETRKLFATVWDGSSDFTRHVQARFNPQLRSKIFGDPSVLLDEGWQKLIPKTATELKRIFGSVHEPAFAIEVDLDVILECADNPAEVPSVNEDDGDAGRYGAIIDFPNFLLHVLRLQFGESRTISLDDKKLVAQFEQSIVTAAEASEFCFRLLRAKFLFDNFMIKPLDEQRGSDDSNWVIHRMHYIKPEARSPKLSPLNAFGIATPQILMLQAMYQVTHQRRVYKEFFFEILKYLDTVWAASGEVDAAGFIDHLHRMAEKDLAALSLATVDALNAGTGVPHFALNLLDYKLWWSSVIAQSPNPDLPSIQAKDFRFAYRTSIEHFLPVNLADREDQQAVVNNLGNLCLMTRTENSRRTDHTPDWKVEKYGTTDQSLKFHYMAALQRERKAWDCAEIAEQGEAMRRVLFMPLAVASDSVGDVA